MSLPVIYSLVKASSQLRKTHENNNLKQKNPSHQTIPYAKQKNLNKYEAELNELQVGKKVKVVISILGVEQKAYNMIYERD